MAPTHSERPFRRRGFPGLPGFPGGPIRAGRAGLRGAAAACALALFLPAAARAQAWDYLEPSEAGPDYALQGEYAGYIDADGGSKALAAQVAALGDGRLRAVFFPGGLPGQGWSGSGRVEVEGTGGRDGAAFPSGTYHGEISMPYAARPEMFTGKGPGARAFRLDKVHRRSPTLEAPPPPGATVLFAGRGLEAWENAKVDSRGFLAPASETNGGAYTRKSFGDFSLHLEFRAPFTPKARGQDRGNSGIVLKNAGSGWGELQILDSFGDEPANNGCGGLYLKAAPRLPACYPPLAWQTYDVNWKAPVFEGNRRVQEGELTVRLNGMPVHQDQVVAGMAATGPITLQEHFNPVFFRNVWVVEGDAAFDFSKVAITALARPEAGGGRRARGGSGRGFRLLGNTHVTEPGSGLPALALPGLPGYGPHGSRSGLHGGPAAAVRIDGRSLRVAIGLPGVHSVITENRELRGIGRP